MDRITNDYQQAVEASVYQLYAVQLSDGGWSVADGPGTKLSEPDELELAGYHLPVRFETLRDALKAIETGPHVMFDIDAASRWSVHCQASGGIACSRYAMSS